MKNPPFYKIYKSRRRLSRPSSSPFGMIYKSWTDAYHAAENLKKRNAGMDTVVRIEKAPFGDGYVVRSTPACVETLLLKNFLRFGMKVPGTFFPVFNSGGSGFDGKE